MQLDIRGPTVIRVPRALADHWRERNRGICRVEAAADGSLALVATVDGREHTTTLAYRPCKDCCVATTSGETLCPVVGLVVTGSVAEWFAADDEEDEARPRPEATRQHLTHEDLLRLEEDDDDDDDDDAETATTAVSPLRTKRANQSKKRKRSLVLPPSKKQQGGMDHHQMAKEGVQYLGAKGVTVTEFARVSTYGFREAARVLSVMCDDQLARKVKRAKGDLYVPV